MRGRIFRVGLVLALMALVSAAWTPRPLLVAGLAMLAIVVLLMVGLQMARAGGAEIWFPRNSALGRLWKAATGGIMLKLGFAVVAVGLVIGLVALAWETPGHPGAYSVAMERAMGFAVGLGVIALGAFIALVSFLVGAVSGLYEERARTHSENGSGDEA